MKRLLSIFLCLGMAYAAMAQVPAELACFYEKVRTHRVIVDFSYSMETKGTKVNGAGHAEIQGKAYRMTMNGVELISDGGSLWLKDPEAQELVIDAFDLSTSSLLDNPILFVTGIESLFDLSMAAGDYAVPSDEFTVASMKVVMLPKEDEGVMSVDVHYTPDFQSIVGAVLYMKDGTVTAITIPSLSFLPLKAVDHYRFDAASLPASWVVTDLR